MLLACRVAHRHRHVAELEPWYALHQELQSDERRRSSGTDRVGTLRERANPECHSPRFCPESMFSMIVVRGSEA